MSGPITTAYANEVRRQVNAWPPAPDMGLLARALHRLAQWRSTVLARTYIGHHGRRIWSGPFAGMEYVESSEGSQLARLLGTYESELHPHFEAILSEGVDCVIDVGCAEGYYAVGLARRQPELVVYAHDISEPARALCSELAAKNDVADRVIIGGEFKPADFQAHAGKRVLVLVDTEGAETDILQPDQAPALSGMNIIVETHDGIRAGVRAEIERRFSPTHDITVVHTDLKTAKLPEWMHQTSHLDLILATWEWRSSPTPWLVMRPKTVG
jgi:hypothetical protein